MMLMHIYTYLDIFKDHYGISAYSYSMYYITQHNHIKEEKEKKDSYFISLTLQSF